MANTKIREASKQRILTKLLAGKYKALRDASRAIHLSSMSAKEQEVVLRTATSYFDKTLVKKALKKVSARRKTRVAVADPRFSKVVPIHVQFARLTHDKKAFDGILQFSRTALDAGLTLPELVEDLEQLKAI